MHHWHGDITRMLITILLVVELSGKIFRLNLEMAENKCKSLDNLLPSAFVGMQSKQAPENVEVYRHELHRE